MKNLFSPGKFGGLKPMLRDFPWMPVLAGACIFVAGCGKKDAVGDAAPPGSGSLASAPAGQEPNLVPATQALQVYIFQHKHKPATVEELVSSGCLKSLPPLPPGKKLAISPNSPTVILVSQ